MIYWILIITVKRWDCEMKISFIGDSYCASVSDKPFESYPFIVAKHFNAKILYSGVDADNLFHAYQTFLEKIEESDYVIFCVSDPNRIPNRYRVPAVPYRGMAGIPAMGSEKLPLGASPKLSKLWSTVFDGNSKIYDDLSVAMVTYKRNMNLKFHKIAQKGILREIDILVKKSNKKCIFFKSFDNSFCDYVPENLVWGDESLHSIKLKEQIGWSKKDLYDEKKFPRINHFFEPNHKKLSKLIIDIIESDNFAPRKIKMEEYL